MKGLGPIQQKIVLLILGGLALGSSRSLWQSFRIIEEISKDWQKINKQQLKRSIESLYRSNIVATKLNKDGSLSLVLTKKGKKIAARYSIKNLIIKKPKKWDQIWRIVVFDIPENIRYLRDIFRHHLKMLGFYEFQKSVFIFPYPCDKEINFLIELCDAKQYIKKITATKIDDDIALRRIFKL